MLSMNSSTSWFFSSRKYSVMARPDKRHAQTRAGRLVHLAIDQARSLDFASMVRLLLDDAGLDISW